MACPGIDHGMPRGNTLLLKALGQQASLNILAVNLSAKPGKFYASGSRQS